MPDYGFLPHNQLGEGDTVEIKRVYEVYCPVCGVVDAPADRPAATKARREHLAWHREQPKSATGSPYAGDAS